jgi:pyruvate formate lyase activating enzyme
MRAAAISATGGPYATVLNIQRMSTEDGPGLRTTVFFKGCTLACRWCHNPEAISVQSQVVWQRSRCIGAGACEARCPEDAIVRTAAGLTIDYQRCTACAECVEHCPSGAMEMLGTRWGLAALVTEVAKDRAYFETSGGGVTVSGGEPAMHVPFVAPFLDRCRALGLRTAVDTSGMCSTAALLTLTAGADLVLYDLKELDPERHTRFTGHSNERILTGLRALAEAMRQRRGSAELWIRTPLIPGATAADDNIQGIGALIARELSDVVTRWELCAFNNLAADKDRQLDRIWEFESVDLLTGTELAHFERIARGSGVHPDLVLVTGRAKLECVDGDRRAGGLLRAS